MSDVIGTGIAGDGFRATHAGVARRVAPPHPEGHPPPGEWRNWRHRFSIGGAVHKAPGAEAVPLAAQTASSATRWPKARFRQVSPRPTPTQEKHSFAPERARSLDPTDPLRNLPCDLSIVPGGSGSFLKGSLSGSARRATREPSKERGNSHRAGLPGDRWNGHLPEVPGVVGTSQDVPTGPSPSLSGPSLSARDYSKPVVPVVHMAPEIQTGEAESDPLTASLSFVAFAEMLVERCGSLLRAFNYCDYNRTGKVTRTQWDATISSLHIDLQAICGTSTKQVFKMMDCINGHGSGDVSFEKWTLFFEQQLMPAHGHLLTEDRGDMRSRRASQSSQCSNGRRPSLGNRAAEELRGGRRPSNSEEIIGHQLQDLEVEATPPMPPSQRRAEEPADGSAQDGHPPRRRFSKGRVSTGQAAKGKLESSAPSKASNASESTEACKDVAESAEASLSDKVACPTPGTQASDNLPDGSAQDVAECAEASLSDKVVDQVACATPGSQTSDNLPDGSAQVSTGHVAEDVAECVEASPSDKVVSQVPCDSEVEMPATELQTDQTVLHAAGKPEEVHEEEKEEEEEVLPFGATTQPPMHEADAVRVPESLLEALTTPASELDLHTLDSTDAEAVLQQDELNQDLKRLNLAGIDALAYILMVKHGSLKRAFDWFDTHRKGKFSHVAWATGMILLRINLETLTGMKPSQVFNMMDGNPQNGFVSRKEWTRFFEALEEGRLAELLEKAAKEQGTIAERVKRRASKLEAERPPPEKPEKPKRGGRRPSAAIASSLVPPADNSAGDALAQEEELFRKRARQALNALGPGDALTFASDTFTKWQTDELSRQKVLSPAALQVPGLLLPEEKCDIVEEVADEMGLWVLSNESDTVSKSKARIGHSNTMALNTSALGGDSAAIVVCNLHNFANEAGDQLKKLKGTHGHLEFPKDLTRTQRFVVHALAAEQELTTLSEGFAGERRLVAYDLGDFAENLRRILQDIGPGETKTLSEKLTAAQRQLVYTMASDMDLSVSGTANSGLQVCNLQQFKAQVHDQLLHLHDGAVVDFGTTLSEEERKVVHETSAALGLTTQTQGRARLLRVANLREFLDAARARFKALKEPEEKLTFGPGLTAMQLAALEELATEAGLRFARRSSADGVTLVVSKAEIPHLGDVEDARSSKGPAGPIPNPDKEASGGGETRVHDPEAGHESHAAEEDFDPRARERDSQVSLITEVFEAYSSGNHRGQRTFLRFSDLREFAEDLRELLPEVRKTFHRFTGELENIYDDTQQLQCDMGDHSAKGLTLRFFQVFIQKVIRRLGPSIVGVLCALVDGRDRV